VELLDEFAAAAAASFAVTSQGSREEVKWGGGPP
jgi:hypothetical protein